MRTKQFDFLSVLGVTLIPIGGSTSMGSFLNTKIMTADEQVYLNLRVKYATLLGFTRGLMEGFLWLDIPEEVKEKLKLKIKELENEKLEHFKTTSSTII